ncbi:MAG TPA: thiamine pyrophosphate-binding protein [Candidatus Binatia bacterium]|nr:thiamine pyrophosphate-binding protein [Candidatus Binatia bacterium]
MTTVVQLISNMLKREGVQYLFGIPGGGGTIDLLDATEKDGIRFVLNSHETASAVMACTIAELTGIPRCRGDVYIARRHQCGQRCRLCLSGARAAPGPVG